MSKLPRLHQQQHPGLHLKSVASRLREVILFCTAETPPGALLPAPGAPAQERHNPDGAGPEEGHKNGERTGAPILWEQAQRVGIFQTAELFFLQQGQWDTQKTPRKVADAFSLEAKVR